MQIRNLRGFSVSNTVKKYRFIKKILPVFTGQSGTNSARFVPTFRAKLSAPKISILNQCATTKQ
jgi:hypothetical protein